MKTVLVMIISAGLALTQQTEKANQQLAPPQLAALQAQLAAIKTDEIRSQSKLLEMLKTYRDSHPNVVALRRKLDLLRAQQEALSQAARHLDALKSATAGLQPGLPGRWWRNPSTAQSLGLTPGQIKKMDDIFQQSRLKLIDVTAALEREEVILEPLVAAEPLDESKIAAQIDRVAQARAELEKANGRMLLGIRKQLTPEQWRNLSQLSSASLQR